MQDIKLSFDNFGQSKQSSSPQPQKSSKLEQRLGREQSSAVAVSALDCVLQVLDSFPSSSLSCTNEQFMLILAGLIDSLQKEGLERIAESHLGISRNTSGTGSLLFGSLHPEDFNSFVSDLQRNQELLHSYSADFQEQASVQHLLLETCAQSLGFKLFDVPGN